MAESATSEQQLLRTDDLYTEFHTFEGVVRALNGVSVFVRPGETYGLVGESGCGKSVTVRSMMRIVQEPGRIVAGSILIFFDEKDKRHGIDLLQQSEAYAQELRGNDISMIFQEASTALNPVLSIEYQVGESFEFHRLAEMLGETVRELDEEIAAGRSGFLGFTKLQRALFDRERRSILAHRQRVEDLDRKIIALEVDEASVDEASTDQATIAALNARRNRMRPHDRVIGLVRRVPILKRYRRRLRKTIRRHVVELLGSLGVPNPENVASRYPHELSGGMQQRIVIAIALACNPKLLIADEPTSNLDVTIQAQIVELIKRLKESTISSVIFITHDLGLVAEVCDRVSVMYAGDVAETASVKDLFRTQLHPYTQGLLASVPKREQTEELQPIRGTVPNLIHPPSGCRFHPRCPHAMEVCRRAKPLTIEKEPDHFVACHLYYDHDEVVAAPAGEDRP
ncbi:MAG: ABC transporter ATP-binding protein [Spirochaetota bacterium]